MTVEREVSPAIALQILTAEHSSLSTSRSLAWNEAFARAGMYLSALAGATIALALVGQGSGFGSSFALFVLLILPVVIFVGESTVIRLAGANLTEATCIVGMNRIRGGYLEIAPDLGRFFVTSAHDDAEGIGVTTGLRQAGVPTLQILAGTPFVIGTINAVVLAVFIATAALQLGANVAVAAAVGVVGAMVLALLHAALARRQIASARANLQPIFPSPPDD
jgi:hypothetical protein